MRMTRAIDWFLTKEENKATQNKTKNEKMSLNSIAQRSFNSCTKSKHNR